MPAGAGSGARSVAKRTAEGAQAATQPFPVVVSLPATLPRRKRSPAFSPDETVLCFLPFYASSRETISCCFEVNLSGGQA